MASEKREEDLSPKCRKINNAHYLESEINEANDILDLIKETRFKIDKTKRLLKILNEVENYGYLDLEDAKFLTNKIKSVLDKSQNKIQDLIENNSKIYLALDLVARSGYGDLVIGLFSDDFQFTATNNENHSILLSRLSYKGHAEWVINHLEDNFLSLIKPECTWNYELIIALVNSNRSNKFFDYIARIYGDKGFETLLNVTSKVQRYKPLLDDSADISGESYWNEILVVIENRFEGYRFMQLLPRKVDFEYLKNKSEVFIWSMDKLLISGAFLALRNRFSLDLPNEDKQNINPNIKTLYSTIRHLDYLFENPGTENMQISLRLQREKRMQATKGVKVVKRNKKKQFEPNKVVINGGEYFSMQEKIHFIQEFRNFDIFQIDNSGSPTYIFRDKNNGRIFFRTKYSNPETYEIISQLQENYLIRNSQIKNGTLQEEFLGLTVGDLMAMNLEDPMKRHIYRQMEIIKTKIEKLGLNHRHPHLNNFNVRFRIEIENKQIIVHSLKKVRKLAEDYKTTFSAEVFIRDYDLIERFQATNTEH